LRNTEGLPDHKEIMDRQREGPIQVEHPVFPHQDGFRITGQSPVSHQIRILQPVIFDDLVKSQAAIFSS
jgi:hypothetical protein